MKRTLLIIGAVLLLPAKQAAALSPACQTLATLAPVSSHYVQKTLTRADAGIAYANQAGGASSFQYVVPWAQQIASAWLSLSDVQLRVTVQQRSLAEASACRRFDTLLIECKMDGVREEMNKALTRGSYVGVMRLQSLLTFLNERLEHLANGGLDPTYVDPTWGRIQLFDPPAPVWCCPGVELDPASQNPYQCVQTTPEVCGVALEGSWSQSLDQCLGQGCSAPPTVDPATEGSMCPYHSDYLDAMESGFGCDEQIMQPRSEYGPLAAELSALMEVTSRTNDFRERAQELLKVQAELEGLLDKDASVVPPPEPRQHQTAYGCMIQSGYCTDLPDVSCRTDGDCRAKKAGSCTLHQGACTGNLAQFCSTDAECQATGAGTCTSPRTQIPLYPLRGAFSADDNHIGILSRFIGLRTTQGETREQSNEFKQPAEFQADDTARRMERLRANPLEQMLRYTARATFSLWSRIQGRSESQIYPAAADAQMNIAEDMGPLRASVSRLTVHSSKPEGIRSFAVKLSYWLRRTCLDRACSKRLDQVLKIALTDACFPYADGSFIADTPANTRWKQCAKAACIPLPGVELGRECE